MPTVCNESSRANTSQNDSLSSQDKLCLSSWGLPESLLQHYTRKGITSMFEWQVQCLTAGNVLKGGNLIYSAPTSAGKTLVSEILISQTVLEKKKKALVILPFVSVVREKMFYFKDMFSNSGVRVEGYMGGHTPSTSFQQVHMAVCTIEKANSLINKLLEEQEIDKLGIVVVDELHLLSDSYRGYLLELLLTKLKYISSVSSLVDIQIVGMSATLPNLKSLSDWLDADLYYTDFRPVPLTEHLKCQTTIFDNTLKKLYNIEPAESEIPDDSEHVGYLCLETIQNGHSVLIFCPTKVWCENLAYKIATYFRKHGCSKSAEIEGSPGWILRRQLNLERINNVMNHLRMSPVGLDADLHRTVAYGVAFHHAGLTLDERDIIEGSFRQGSIRVLCATSTLSSGVNLPARRVIIRSPMSFGGLMDILTYRQMIGRAGRMGVDTEGESILICKPSEKQLCQQLMTATLKPIQSCLGEGRLSASLKRAILEVVASGVACTPDQVKRYAGCTFLAHSSQCSLVDPILSCIQFLEENEFLRMQDDGRIYKATPLGQACLASSLPPDEGLLLFRELERARRCFVLDTDLHILYQVTPYSVSEQWSKIDWLQVLSMLEALPPSMRRVGELVGVQEAFLVKIVKGTINPGQAEHRGKLSVHRRFYTALALQDLVNEVPLTQVADKFHCNKGMLQSLQQSAATYAGMVTEFTRRLGWSSVELIISQFQDRLQFGIQRELCDLMRLPLLNCVRARALYSAGFTTISSLANANVISLENALHSATPFQTRKEIAGETAFDRDQRNKMQAMWVTGKSGLSVQEAAETLVKESRGLLELELGIEGAKWGVVEASSQTHIANALQISQTHKANALPTSQTHTADTLPTSQTHTADTLPTSQTHTADTLPTSQTHTADTLPTSQTHDVRIVKTPQGNHNGEDDSGNERYMVETDIAETIPEIPPDTEAEMEIELEDLNLEPVLQSEITVVQESDEDEMEVSIVKEVPRKLSDLTQTEEADEVVFVMETRRQSVLGRADRTDYFTTSVNFDNIVFDAEEKKEAVQTPPVSRATAKRLSHDMFETPHPKSLTPKFETAVSQPSVESPDLFSESLTFDTQLNRVLEDDVEVPTDVELATIKQTDAISASFFDVPLETQFQPDKPTPVKRKLNGVRSPDIILESDESWRDEKPTSKKAKVSFLGSRIRCQTKRRAEVMTLEGESDDEIMPTPRPQPKTTRTEVPSRRARPTLKLRRVPSATKISGLFRNGKPPDKSNDTKVIDLAADEASSVLDLTEFDIVEVGTNRKVFESFCVEFKQHDVVGLAAAFRSDVDDKKPKIGSKILNRRTESRDDKKNLCCHDGIMLVGLAFYWSSNDVYFMSMGNECVSLKEKVDFLSSSCDQKVFRVFDSREQLKMLKSCLGILLGGAFEDCKIASWLCSKDAVEPSIPSLVSDFYPAGQRLVGLLGQPAGTSSFCLQLNSTVSPKLRASVEALLSYDVMNRQLEALRDLNLTQVFKEVEMPVSLCLVHMEVKGLFFSRVKILEVKKILEQSMADLEKKAHTLAQHQFSLGSYVAVSKVLYSELNLAAGQHRNKKPGTSKEDLQRLTNDTKHPLPEIILQWRKLRSCLCKVSQINDTKHQLPAIILQWRKLRSYLCKVLCPLLRLPVSSTRVLGSSQTFTATGRISMREPNMQSVPRPFQVDEVAICIRDVFTTPPGYVIVSADYCQIELRVLAHLSGDEDLVTSILGCKDVFVSIAADIHAVSTDMVTDEMRQRAKQTCYGMIYGIGARALSQQLQITEEEAGNLMTDFTNKYTGVKNFLVRTVKCCRETGFVETVTGRRRHLPAINHSTAAVQAETERQAVNTTVQGSAADLTKAAMVAVWRRVHLENIDASLVLHLHDELLYEVYEDHVTKMAVVLKEAMESAMILSVPIPIKIRCGPSWGKLDLFTS